MAASLICGRLSAGLRNSGSRTALSSAAKVGFGEGISSAYGGYSLHVLGMLKKRNEGKWMDCRFDISQLAVNIFNP